MTRAFVHCHQRKVLHLDVKLVNVLVTKGICKLGDFGYSVSIYVGAKAFLVSGYQAPELLLGKSPVLLVISEALEFCFDSWTAEKLPVLGNTPRLFCHFLRLLCVY